MIKAKRITIDGINVAYKRCCETNQPKGVILFLHGWQGSSNSWISNIEELCNYFDCLALDLPGFGESPKPNKIWDIYDYAKFLVDFISAMNLPQFTLVGKSFGGRIAIVFSTSWPERLKSLVLVSAAGTEKRSTQSLLKILLAKVGKFATKLMPFIKPEPLRQKYYKVMSIPDEKDSYKREVKKRVTNQKLSSLLTKIKIPTLIVWGSDDKILPIGIARRMLGMINNARLVIVEKAGHDAHETHPKEFDRYLLDFLGQK